LHVGGWFVRATPFCLQSVVVTGNQMLQIEWHRLEKADGLADKDNITCSQ